MTYTLDTNICSYIMRNSPPKVAAKFQTLKQKDVCISSIVFFELRFGVINSQRVDKNQSELEKFMRSLNIIPFDKKAAESAAVIRKNLQRSGTPIGPMDILIAAHALSKNATLVTNNTREFERVAGLTVENWV